MSMEYSDWKPRVSGKYLEIYSKICKKIYGKNKSCYFLEYM